MLSGVMLLFVCEIKGVKLRLCFSFPAVLSLSFLMGEGNSGKLLVMLACCALHECGHIAATLLCGCKPGELTLYGGGIKLTTPVRLNSFKKDIFILASGCGVNFLLAFASCLVKGELTFFAQVNLLLGGFNLLPVGYLDGGKMLELVLNGRGAVWIKGCFALLVAVLAVLCAVNGHMSVTLVCVLLYMFISYISAFVS